MTLIEVLISMVIMTVIVLSVAGLVPYSFNELQVNSAQIQAVAVGQQYLDALRNAKQGSNPLPSATTAPIDQGDSFVSGSANTDTGLFTVTPNTCPSVNGGTINQYDCVVTVTWTENSQHDSIKVEDYVTAP